VEVEVAGYALPDATDYRTVVDLVESPESVALQYGVPLWSDRHFELLAASYRQLARIGNRSMYVHLVAESNMGNSESIVRWIPRPGGGYGYDFAPFDKYLDTVVKNMGAPKMVVLYLWDYHLRKRGKAPVTLVDKSGKTSTIELPLFNTDEGAALWKPVADHIMTQLKARGLAGAAMLGPIPDTAPPKDVADRLSDLFPGARWMRQGHSARRDIQGHPIAYQALVWTPRWPDGPDAESMHGWDQDDDIVQFMRSGEDTPLTIPRLLGEMNIIGRQKGFGRIGADFWPVLKTPDNRGGTRSSDIIGRYPDSTWNNLEWMTRYMIVPGENGAVSTTRYEMMCEGIHECQAVILLDEALTKRTVSGELARRCGEALKARLSATITAMDNHLNSGLTKLEGHSWWSTPTLLGNEWFVGSRWQDRSATLYSLAGEVQDGRGATAAGDQQK
jgi:hypothetical protein